MEIFGTMSLLFYRCATLLNIMIFFLMGLLVLARIETNQKASNYCNCQMFKNQDEASMQLKNYYQYNTVVGAEYNNFPQFLLYVSLFFANIVFFSVKGKSYFGNVKCLYRTMAVIYLTCGIQVLYSLQIALRKMIVG